MEYVKYIVTDPCYILPDDIWTECCEKLDIGNEAFNQAVSNALTKYTNYPAFACHTGFGDWTNELWSNGINIIKSDFFADAGMVCVCRLTAKIAYEFKKKYSINVFSGLAIFEASQDISVDFDCSDKFWTVLTVTDTQTGYKLISSEACSEDNDDDEYYNEKENY